MKINQVWQAAAIRAGRRGKIEIRPAGLRPSTQHAQHRMEQIVRNQSGRMTVPEHVDERERCSLPILSGDELLVLAQRLSK